MAVSLAKLAHTGQPWHVWHVWHVCVLRQEFSAILGTNTHRVINETTALSNPAVFACVRVIAETIATLPCNVYYKSGGRREKAKNHKLYSLLHDSPDGIITAINFFETIITHVLIYGNAFVEIERDRFSNVKSLHILNPNKVVLKALGDALIYEYNSGCNIITYSIDNIVHIAGLGGNGIVGFSPIALFANDIATMMSQRDFALDFFSNGAKKTPVLTTESKLKPETKASLKASFRDSWNKGIVLLEEGIKIEPITMALSDAQFLESRRFSVEEIARIYRVPPHMIGDLSRATFSNIEEQTKLFVRDTIRPWCTRIEKAFDLSLFNDEKRGKYFIKFSVDAMLRGDAIARQQAYKTQLENGIISRNEWRALEDLPPLDDEYADDYFVSQQLRPIQTAYMVDDNKKTEEQPHEKKKINDSEASITSNSSGTNTDISK